MSKKEKKPFYKRKWVWAVIALVVIVAAMPTNGKGDDKDKPQNQSKVEDIKPPETEKSISDSEGKAETKPEQTTTPEHEKSATTGEKNALKKAQSYLSFSAFSYNGLIGQLEYEQYSHDEAVYAADNCGADWNEQAVAKAKS